jgi:hypothetical protein
MRGVLGCTVFAGFVVIASACGLVENALYEFPPQLLMEVDLNVGESQPGAFGLPRAGRYEVKAHLELQ